MSAQSELPPITIEQITEMDQTGAVQLNAAYMPEDFKQLVMAAASEEKHSYRPFYKIAAAYGALPIIHSAVLEVAGYVPDAQPPLRVTLEYDMRSRTSMHQDFGGGRLAVSGYTLVMSVARTEGVNRLITAGRGAEPSRVKRTFDYANGPILLAQRNFSLLGGTGEKQQVWHKGMRTAVAAFLSLDITVPLR